MRKPISLAIEPEVRAKLEQIATAEERSRSQVANRALREWLAARQPQQPTTAAQETHA